MAEKLKTTRYNDGVSIAYVINNNQWGSISIGAYCLNYRSEFYAALYNWYAVKSGRLCPEGWRVPTAADWIILTELSGLWWSSSENSSTDGCDEEAVRLVKMMPRWEPGRQSVEAVRVQFTMLIRFRSN